MASQVLLGAGIFIAGISIAPIVLGFGTAGIAAGSTAAAIQSGIGCVQAGSWFATATSLGMQGTFVYTAAGGTAVAAGAGTLIVVEEAGII